MKKFILYFSLSLFFIGCGNNKTDSPADSVSDTTEAATAPGNWNAILNDSTGEMEMVKQSDGGPEELTPQSVVDYINLSNPNIKLVITRLANDTLYLQIAEASYLTQQMGSAGPELYFASAVYNLTEIPGIRFVTFEFEEGDHARPGTYTRDNVLTN